MAVEYLSQNNDSQEKAQTPPEGVMRMPQTLSVAIITLNEEKNIARTLASVGFADEVILVDSGSTDRTVEIARSMNAKVIQEPWKGFAAQKNFAIEQCTGTWVLSLDADEELTSELQTEIRALLRGKPDAEAYMLRRRNLFLNRWIRHGGYYPDPKLRLFRRHAANFAPPARFTERPVHETVSVEGRIETLHADLIHHAYPTIESYLEHMDRYSTLGAEILIAKGQTSRSWLGFYYNVLLIPAATFLWNYVFRLGFLDGREGFLLHLYHSTYTSWKYAKAWQTTRKS
ncbi:glycosyltransferase family 2 protein [Edaphobacter bradus]|uniref:glycosyltransferase family 2 protein n=1 Tax=Edaphobacter bradus TaxID=2259016 RepID=UPI00295AD2C5|nr:glycosyltransferase family 2 protein [Edaphobacter bradus]